MKLVSKGKVYTNDTVIMKAFCALHTEKDYIALLMFPKKEPNTRLMQVTLKPMGRVVR
jgi:hypothetical protein